MALLELKNISVHYGGVKALNNASIEINENEIAALMGPNGAGKSTVIKAMFGLAPIDSGQICWQNIPFIPIPHKIVAKGVSCVPQGRRVFNNLTVHENLEIGGYVVRDKKELEKRINEAFNLFPDLKTKKDKKSGTLSGGQQQMLAIARGLMTNPKVLLLDEPSLGLAPKIVKELFELIKNINEKHKTSILVVEHNLKSLLPIAHRAYVLDKGSVLAHDKASVIEKSDILERVFMGQMNKK